MASTLTRHHLLTLTADDIGALYRNGELSVLDVVKTVTARIKEDNSRALQLAPLISIAPEAKVPPSSKPLTTRLQKKRISQLLLICIKSREAKALVSQWINKIWTSSLRPWILPCVLSVRHQVRTCAYHAQTYRKWLLADTMLQGTLLPMLPSEDIISRVSQVGRLGWPFWRDREQRAPCSKS